MKVLLKDFLLHKGTQVYSIQPQATMDKAVQKLVRHNIGSLVVCETDEEDRPLELQGIITERDVLRACSASAASLATSRVEEFMSVNVVTGSPQDTLEDVMLTMTKHRIRHLPVSENGRLRGIVSISDVVRAQLEQVSLENHLLKNYIQS